MRTNQLAVELGVAENRHCSAEFDRMPNDTNLLGSWSLVTLQNNIRSSIQMHGKIVRNFLLRTDSLDSA